MSNNYFITNLLNIKDKNLNFSDGIYHKVIKGVTYTVLTAKEGWDDENNRAGEDYKYYDKLIIKDLDSNIIEEKIGSLHQSQDGTWWLA